MENTKIRLSIRTSVEEGKDYLPGDIFKMGGIEYIVLSNTMDSSVGSSGSNPIPTIYDTHCSISMVGYPEDLSSIMIKTPKINSDEVKLDNTSDNEGWGVGKGIIFTNYNDNTNGKS